MNEQRFGPSIWERFYYPMVAEVCGVVPEAAARMQAHDAPNSKSLEFAWEIEDFIERTGREVEKKFKYREGKR